LVRILPVFLICLVASAANAAPNRRTDLLSNLPLRFEDARGLNRDARYVASANGFHLYLAPRGSWLEWHDPSGTRSARVETTFENSRAVNPEAGDRLPGAANYFIGATQEWRENVAGYQNIRYRGIYPGVDLVFRGDSGQLEYDFVLAPHANPRVIKFNITGQRSLAIDSSGNLVVSTDAGDIRWKRPEIYEESEAGGHIPVAGSFVIVGKHTVAFQLDAYNSDHRLVIDPALTYSTFLGGNGNEFARGIGLDGAGNVYIAGGTSTPNLTTVSALQPNFGGQTANAASGDAFVAKFSPSGTLLYLTYLGGSADDTAMALAVDAAGNAYVTGFTTSTNFPTAGTPYQAKFGGFGGGTVMRTGDAFVAKIAPAGNQLIYSTYLGGSADDFALAIAIDGTGAAYITGGTVSTNFPVSSTAYLKTFQGKGGQQNTFTYGIPLINAGDAFVAKLDPTGSNLLFSTYLGGGSDDVGSTIAIDSSNNVYVAGFTLSILFPTTQGAYQRVFGGADPNDQFFQTGDGFITKLKPDGSGVIYSTLFGGPGDDYIQSIAVDASGNVYFTGSSGSQNIQTTPGVAQPFFSGPKSLPAGIENIIGDAVVGKLNAAGSAMLYLTWLGGSQNDAGTAIAIDPTGDAYVVGFSDSTDFPLSQGAYQTTMKGDGGGVAFLSFGDAFLSVLDPNGVKLIYSTYLGGTKDDMALGVALDKAGNIYIAGNTYSANFPSTANAVQKTYGGSQTVYTFPLGDAFYSTFSAIPTNPVVSGVANAESGATFIAPNTWVAIYGTGLAGPNLYIWQASDFVGNNMPTTINGVSVQMNGQSAYPYYTTSTQLGVLTPPNLTPGPVQVTVTNSGVVSAQFTVQDQAIAPSFFVISGTPYVLAQHASPVSLIGPTTLTPGSYTPAQSGETIVIYMNGCGPTTVPVVAGSVSQSGTLNPQPQIFIGSILANVRFAGLISEGLYQVNVDVPPGLKSGDNSITASVGGVPAQTGILLTIK
jgi:uncharacterized protein (TIGR03437 family)